MASVVRMLAFAGARDVVGRSEFELTIVEPCTTDELFDRVCAAYPGLSPYRGSIRLAVNGVYARPADPVQAGDEVALIPPVAGG
jgi:molybdopterin synthase sulfur carrier subunit